MRRRNNGQKSGGSMATDMNRLQGEIVENPTIPVFKDGEDAAVERLIVGFLRALLEEQKPAPAPVPMPATGNEVPSYLQLRSQICDQAGRGPGREVKESV
jgi:hypothetical protein